MRETLIVKRSRRKLVPEGIYKALVDRVERTEHEEYGQRIQFTFSVDGMVNEDGSPVLIFRSCSENLSPRSALTSMIQSITGNSLADDKAEEGFDLMTLVKCPVQIVVKHNESSSGNTYPVVDSVVHLDEPELDDPPF